jgi:hypothetical protein
MGFVMYNNTKKLRTMQKLRNDMEQNHRDNEYSKKMHLKKKKNHASENDQSKTKSKD